MVKTWVWYINHKFSITSYHTIYMAKIENSESGLLTTVRQTDAWKMHTAHTVQKSFKEAVT